MNECEELQAEVEDQHDEDDELDEGVLPSGLEATSEPAHPEPPSSFNEPVEPASTDNAIIQVLEHICMLFVLISG